MKRAQHKLTIERRVVEVSQKLFLENGYSKTTIKDITEKAGITTGSLYHFFGDKEEILRHITKDMFDAAAAMADEIGGGTGRPWLRFALEIGMQFYFVLAHKPVAELYLTAHQSGNIGRLILQSAQSRNQAIFQTVLPHLTSDDYFVMSLAVKGIVHSFVQEVVHSKKKPDPGLISRAVEMTLLIFQIPKNEMTNTIQKTHELINQYFADIYRTVRSESIF